MFSPPSLCVPSEAWTLARRINLFIPFRHYFIDTWYHFCPTTNFTRSKLSPRHHLLHTSTSTSTSISISISSYLSPSDRCSPAGLPPESSLDSFPRETRLDLYVPSKPRGRPFIRPILSVPVDMAQMRGNAGGYGMGAPAYGGGMGQEPQQEPSPFDAIRQYTSKLEDILDTAAEPVKPYVSSPRRGFLLRAAMTMIPRALSLRCHARRGCTAVLTVLDADTCPPSAAS